MFASGGLISLTKYSLQMQNKSRPSIKPGSLFCPCQIFGEICLANQIQIRLMIPPKGTTLFPQDGSLGPGPKIAPGGMPKGWQELTIATKSQNVLLWLECSMATSCGCNYACRMSLKIRWLKPQPAVAGHECNERLRACLCHKWFLQVFKWSMVSNWSLQRTREPKRPPN